MKKIINLFSGNGGNGYYKVKTFRANNIKGGNGGNGGNIYIKFFNNIDFFRNIKNNSILKSENGKNGKNNNKNGKNGKDLIINIPINTEIINYYTKEIINIKKNINNKNLILKGGKGGIGYHNKSKIKSDYLGNKGLNLKLILILKLKSDILTIGLSNSGKSSFIHSLINNSNKKFYNFNTKKCNLYNIKNDNFSFSIIDTPGIKILNNKNYNNFIYNIKDSKIIVYIIDINYILNNNLIILLNKIESIIKFYNKKLLFNNISYIVLNKIDLLNNYNKIKYIYNNSIFKKKIFFISSKYKLGINNLLYNIKTKLKK